MNTPDPNAAVPSPSSTSPEQEHGCDKSSPSSAPCDTSPLFDSLDPKSAHSLRKPTGLDDPDVPTAVSLGPPDECGKDAATAPLDKEEH